LDLGNWASGKYAIPGNLKDELDETDEVRKPEGPTQ
jgi:endogenous inhibitor of DNA gyrase (YacG/DUF329 family)